jgi:hypothetical protein
VRETVGETVRDTVRDRESVSVRRDGEGDTLGETVRVSQ